MKTLKECDTCYEVYCFYEGEYIREFMENGHLAKVVYDYLEKGRYSYVSLTRHYKGKSYLIECNYGK